jgi:hypothetical protein
MRPKGRIQSLREWENYGDAPHFTYYSTENSEEPKNIEK